MGDTTMATLTGSEKQIAWAERIRAERIQCIAADADTYSKEEPEFREELLAALAAFVATVAPASWWIEHRGWMGYEMRTAMPKLAARRLKGAF